MPKKFRGGNPKAEAARERKATVKQAAEDQKRQEEDDAYWRDGDKHASKKQERKTDRERRKQEQTERKQVSRKLLEEEEAQLGTGGKSKGAASTKVTRAEIEAAQALQRTERKKAAATPLPKGVVEDPAVVENPNLLLRQRQLEGEEEARTVDEAIAVLGTPKEPVDMHPEKRLKAAYTAFEERELPRLKAENPNLRLSQLKQMLRKDWMKSPDNPMNQY